VASKINKVKLGGTEYYVRGQVVSQPVSDFAANIRIGEESYDARQGAGFNVFEDFSGGPGISHGLSREDLARFAHTTGVDTRIPRQATLPLKATAGTGIAGGAGNVFARRRRTAMHYEVMGAAVRIVFLSGTHLYSAAADGSAWVDEGEPASGQKLQDMDQYQPVEGTLGQSGVPRLFVCNLDTTAAPGNNGLGHFTPSGGGGTWTALTESFPARTLMEYDNKLLVLANATFEIAAGIWVRPGHVYVSLDGDTLVKDSGGAQPDPIWRLPNSTIGRFIGPARSPWGELAPYYMANKLYVLDFYARRYYPVPLDISDIRAGCVWQDGLVLTDGLHIVHYVPGDPGVVRPIDIVRDQGFLDGEAWYVDALWGDIGGYLYAQITDGTYMWIWEYRGATWHPIGKRQTGVPAGLLVTDKSHSNWGLAAPQKRIWQFSQTPTAFSIDFNEGSDNPLVGTGHFENDAGGYKLETPWLDGGFRELVGAAFQMWCAGDFDTNTSCKVQYAVDGDDSTWYTLGTFNGTQTHFNFKHNATGAVAGTVVEGQEFTTIKFRFTLYGDTGDDTSTPQPLPMTFVFRKKPGLRMSYLFTVDVSRNIDEGVVANFETLYAQLRVLWNTKRLVAFSYADVTATKVDLVSMPTSEQEIVSSRRRGRVAVQVMEPVDW